MTMIAAAGLTKSYGSEPHRVPALRGVDVAIPQGTFTAVMGPSGSGKSTLLHCLSGLDTVDAGTVRIGAAEITALSERALTRLRRERVGFVFQAFNLLPTLTARENIVLPLELTGRRPESGHFDAVVELLGLADRLAHRPSELSGGQAQRVAMARALITRPDVVFADEPTGNLDRRTGRELLDLLRRSVSDLGQTVVMVTHDPAAAARTDRVLLLADGRMVDDLVEPSGAEILRRLDELDELDELDGTEVHPEPEASR
ncbi:putative ABC transport system ATP-binding protein [Catenulispora sp. GP43]|uniref:ABC transporter ATP-binding protein n=1 Tax=Catenulispora sp. GP43 TaxID=3156263 RepID=UPI0035118B2B